MTPASRVRSWLRSRRSLVGTVTATATIVAIVAGAAIASTGYTAQKVQLDDGSVWVTSNLHQAVGRANPPVGELNTAVRLQSGSLAVSQFAQTVVVTDLGGGEARLIDTAAAEVTGSFALPVGEVGITVGDELTLILSRTSGDLWTVPTSALAGFDPSTPPDLTLGAGGDAVLAPDSTVYAVSPAAGRVFTLKSGGSADAAGESVALEASADVGITSVGSHWVVLDRSGGRLLRADRVLPLDLATPGAASEDDGATGATDPTDGAEGTASAETTSPAAGARLALPAPQSDSVLVATSAALLDVSLETGAATELSTGHSADAAAPVRTGDCWYAAWADGRSWSRCGVADAVEGELAGAGTGADLVFLGNGLGALVLSDTVTGRSWDVLRGNAVIDDWEALLPDTTNDQSAEAVVTDRPADVDPTQRPPVAVDDDLGARPARSSMLAVLQNDHDPNDDVIVIDSVQVPDGADYTVDLIADGQQLQLTLPAGASGEVAFGYTISDGQGGTADATVRVTVRGDAENSPPVQSRQRVLDVASGQRAAADIRSDWYDPDGDAFYLQQAGAADGDAVTFTPEGRITFSDSGSASDPGGTAGGTASGPAGGTAGDTDVTTVVSDGVASIAGALTVRVARAADVPLIAEGFAVQVRVGEEVQLAPLDHVTGAGAALRLSNVPAHDGYTLQPDYAGGTLRLTARAAGSVLLDYAVADGERSASGVIRVIATVPPDANARPITVPHSAFARSGESTLVDVLAQDFDPAGGVLIVGEATAGTPDDGVRVEVIDQRLVRVTITRPLETGASAIGYRVTNGLAEATGTITVVQIPDPGVRQPPVATADAASVRVGDVVDIPVLDNDLHPDGDALTLDPLLVRGLSGDSGLLFASGDHLRYLAPRTPGDFSAVYRVDAPDGQWTTATLTISVREADATANAAPVAEPLTARVTAGETVRVPVPLDGIDADGDSVQFLGIDSVPDKGIVTATGSDWLEFEAGDYSTGTDSFRYTVVDRLGARATGSIRIGIGPRPDGARNPVATPDEVDVRPGRTVLMRVLDNDSDPDGGALRLTGVTPQNPEVVVAMAGDLLSIDVPAQTGRYGFVYEIANERGGTASSFATLDVSADAPLARPQVSDTVLSLSDILDSDTVDVDVLDNVFFAEGSASRLWLSVLPAFAEVARVVGGEVRVRVQAQQQVIPFTVAHPDDPNIRSSGFIWVPGLDDALPQLRADAPALSVPSGALLRIDLAEQVVAIGGRTVVITDANAVRATHADGSGLVADDHTLEFRSAEGYYGPASISFDVTDGTGPDARTATLVLPITVTPRDNQPPVFTGAVIELEPGQQKVIDLARLTTAPAGQSTPPAFQLLEPKPAGFGGLLVGSTLTVFADPGAVPGDSGALTVGVSAGSLSGRPGRIELSVVPSTRPLAAPATDTVLAPRGTTTQVDVLANDAATNPFPETPLRVVAVRGVDAATLPSGVTVTPSSDNATLRVAVSAVAAPADITVQYQVLDATGSAARAAWGTARIKVLDRPGPVRGVAVTGFGDRSIAVTFSPGAANNSPITGFEVTARTAAGTSITTPCPATSCVVGTPANGPENAVTLSVVARNPQGASDATAFVGTVWSDLLPAAPQGLTLHPLDGALTVRWSPAVVPGGGSPVRRYDIAVDGRTVQTIDLTASDPSTGGCDGAGCSTTISGLTNGASTTVTVTAQNGAYPAFATWPTASASGIPFGAPGSAVVTAAVDPGGAPGVVTLSWPEFPGNGDPVTGYFAQLLAPGVTSVPSGAQACSVSSPAPGSVSAPQVGGAVSAQQALDGAGRGTTFTGLSQVDTAYSFVVWGHNAAGCVASAVATAVSFPSPGQVDAGQVGVEMVQSGTTVDVKVVSAPTPSPMSNGHYTVQRVDSSGGAVGAPAVFTLGGYPRALTGGAFGDTYRFTIRACSEWNGVEACGPYSAVVQAPEPSLTFDFGTGPAYDGRSWGWGVPPRNGTLAASYYCGSRSVPPSRDAAAGSGSATSCTTGGAPARGDAWLLVAIGSYDYVYFG